MIYQQGPGARLSLQVRQGKSDECSFCANGIGWSLTYGKHELYVLHWSAPCGNDKMFRSRYHRKTDSYPQSGDYSIQIFRAKIHTVVYYIVLLPMEKQESLAKE